MLNQQQILGDFSIKTYHVIQMVKCNTFYFTQAPLSDTDSLDYHIAYWLYRLHISDILPLKCPLR